MLRPTLLIAAVAVLSGACSESPSDERAMRLVDAMASDTHIGLVPGGSSDLGDSAGVPSVDGALPDAAAPPAPPPPPTLQQAIATITQKQLEADLGTIASDAYGGRNPGTPGGEKILDYVENIFKTAGLAPPTGQSSMRQKFTVGGTPTANIIGVMPGTDPLLKDEVVIVGGHHDHVGTSSDSGCGASASGNNICNGADDNGSGCTTIINVARALALLKGQNRRTLVFMTFGAEEKGLVGSRYYVEQAPLYPLSKTVYMINVDMVGYSQGGSVQALGGGRSQATSSIINQAAATYGVTPQITEKAGGGSDHYHFALAKVPYVFFFTGFHPCYHKTCDTVDRINFVDYTKIVKTVAHLAWEVTQRDQSPREDFASDYVMPAPSFKADAHAHVHDGIEWIDRSTQQWIRGPGSLYAP
ncbi:MAG: M20/M25/M40 family metallo-hydrolase [Myxococcales bacterium]|nr:M20/M25/M40 family metallo-hydrolase [Myxococcales bacterium]